MIYADNAATTRIDKSVVDAMLPWLEEEYANASQPYSFSKKAKKALEEARSIIGKCIHAEPDEIYFTSGGTESDNWAIKGSISRDQKKRTIITSAIEHHAILNTCTALEDERITTVFVKPNSTGIISASELSNVIDQNTALISIMYVNNEIGCIEPIKELANVAKEKSCIFHSDAVQAVGHINIDVRDLNIDMLSASAHKFNGPKGVGFLFVKSGTQISSINHGGAQERNMRAGTENIASIVGMAKALENNCSKLEENIEHILALEQELLSILEMERVHFIRNGTNHIPGILSLSFKGADGEAILHRLDLKKICVATGAACNSGRTTTSHVLKAIGLDEEYAYGTVRISLGKNNTIEEVRVLAKEISKIVGENEWL